MSDIIVAFDGTDPATTMYFQTSRGDIYKWQENKRYIADKGSLWDDRATINYRLEVR